MDDDILKILDRRTPYEAGVNYHRSKKNEEIAMSGFLTVLELSVGLGAVWAEKIDEKEEWLDGKLHIKPDYWLFIQKKGEEVRKWTIEVKTTAYEKFLNDEILIKAPQVYSCKNEPNVYPNSYILASTYREFCLIPMGSFWNSPPVDLKFGSMTKKGFVLNCNDYKWNEYDIPLEFERKDK